MKPNDELAPDAVRHDDIDYGREEGGIETKASRPLGPISRRLAANRAPSRSAADPTAAIVSAIDAQTREIKAAVPRDITRVTVPTQAPYSAKMRAVHELRQRSESRSNRSDPLERQTMARLNNEIDRAQQQENRELRARVRHLERKAARPMGPTMRGLPGLPTSQRSQATAMYQKSVRHYLRTGQEVFAGQHLRDLQRKAGMHTESGPDGGYLVHPEHDTGPVERYLSQIVAMRQLATVRTISAFELVMPFNRGGIDGGWVAERQERQATDTPDIAELKYPAMELYAMPEATQRMLEDSALDIEGFLAEEVSIKFGEMEDVGFIAGNAQTQPDGVLGKPGRLVDDENWSAGKIGFIRTGVSGDFPSDEDGFVKLIDLTTALKSGYRANASWLMNRLSVGKVRTIKDGQGRFIWEPSGKEGQPQSLLNYPLAECDAMPDFAADSYPIGFGDWKRGYLIVDRTGLNVLRDPYTRKPYIRFYTTKRVGGGVRNDEAIKFLKASAA